MHINSFNMSQQVSMPMNSFNRSQQVSMQINSFNRSQRVCSNVLLVSRAPVDFLASWGERSSGMPSKALSPPGGGGQNSKPPGAQAINRRPYHTTWEHIFQHTREHSVFFWLKLGRTEWTDWDVHIRSLWEYLYVGLLFPWCRWH